MPRKSIKFWHPETGLTGGLIFGAVLGVCISTPLAIVAIAVLQGAGWVK